VALSVSCSALSYVGTAPWHNNLRDFLQAVLLASICSCVAGLIRTFRDRR